jgi:hypothetical protein
MRIAVPGIERLSGPIREVMDTLLAQLQAYRPQGAQVYSTRASQSIPASTSTALQWSASTVNQGELWLSSLPTRITIKRSGLYVVTGQAIWLGETNVGLRKVTITKNGGRQAAQEHLFAGIGANTYSRSQNVAAVLPLVAGDYLELVVWHDLGAPASILCGADRDSHFSAVLVG